MGPPGRVLWRGHVIGNFLRRIPQNESVRGQTSCPPISIHMHCLSRFHSRHSFSRGHLLGGERPRWRGEREGAPAAPVTWRIRLSNRISSAAGPKGAPASPHWRQPESPTAAASLWLCCEVGAGEINLLHLACLWALGCSPPPHFEQFLLSSFRRVWDSGCAHSSRPRGMSLI